jgi:hypothetical protein
MQIIQISDFHIIDDSQMDSIKNRIEKLYDAMKTNLNKNECTVFCVIGDIIDKGNAEMYKNAMDVFNYMKKIFAEFNPKFEFTPGNHDLCLCPYSSSIPEVCPAPKCTLEPYNNFVRDFDSSYKQPENVIHKEYDDIDLLLINSVFHGNCKYGSVDIAALKNKNLKKPALFVTHHAFLSERDTDNAAIRNAYSVFDEIEQKEIIGVLHGHLHGYKNITIGNNCPIIGVGPFFKEITDIPSQVNLVIVASSGIHKVINFFYRGKDIDQYYTSEIYTRDYAEYKGTDLGKIYKEIVSDVKQFGIIPNIRLNIKMPYQVFNEQIERLFHEQIDAAKLWQDIDGSQDDLYFNHGQYMKYDKVVAIDFIIDQLVNKPTSSKAIIPLVNFKDVYEIGDGFLPSFDLIQLGFLEDTRTNLLVTLYLRALEVNHFLKINLCEIYLLCKNIKHKIRSIENINVNILAFKAQYKEKFGCFKRAEIDKISESKLTIKLEHEDPVVLQYLTEKKDLAETVMVHDGMRIFVKVLRELDGIRPIKKAMLDQSQNILNTMEKLKLELGRTSNYSSTEEIMIRRQLDEQFNVIIDLYEGGIYGT